jgi:hypothetical protein
LGQERDVEVEQKAAPGRKEDLHQNHKRSAVLCQEARSQIYGILTAGEGGGREEGAGTSGEVEGKEEGEVRDESREAEARRGEVQVDRVIL